MENVKININSNGITTLATAGKYCDRNIDVEVLVEGGGGDVIEGELFLTADGEEFLTADDEQFITSQDRLVDVSKFPSSPSEEIVYKRIVPKVVDGIYRVTGSGEIRKLTQTNATYNYLIVNDHTAVKKPVASDGETYTWYIDNTGIWYYVNGTWHDLVSEYEGEVYRGLLYDNPYAATLSSASWYVYVSETDVSFGIPTAETDVWKYVAGSEKAFIYMVSGGASFEVVSYFNDALGLGLLGYKVVNNESEINKSDTKYVYVVKSTKMFFVCLFDKDWQSRMFTEVENKDSIPSADGAYGYYYGGQKKWVSFDAEIDKLKEQLSEADGTKNFMDYAELAVGENGVKLSKITNKNISVIEIHPSITEIGKSAFAYCDNLTSVVIGDSVTTIGYGAFEDCTSLTSVEIPDSVTSIDSSAFSGCTSLTSIVIPDSVTSIESNAFSDCTSLTSIVIGNGVTSIGWCAFDGCDSLTSVVIPDSVTTIDSSAFYFCTNLTSVDIGDRVTTIDSSAFSMCTSLTSIVIPDSVTSIGSSAFSGCSNLTSVEIGNSVTTISDSAFSECTSLTSVHIPDSVTTIGGSAFSNCTSLTSITVSEGNSNYKSIDGNLYTKDGKTLIQYIIRKTATSFTIPDSVTKIGQVAFYKCTSLTSVVIPNGVTSIDFKAFYGCNSLVSITYTGTMEQWNAITKGTDWDEYTGEYTIHCTDGDIAKQ